jgi:hypothetical protein
MHLSSYHTPKHADFLLRNNIPRPLSVRSRILLSDFSLPDCSPSLVSVLPHFRTSAIPSLPKSSTPPVQFQERFLELYSRFSEAAVYFTDRAKGGEGVGIGIAYGNKAVAAPLVPLSSIFTFEATALREHCSSQSDPHHPHRLRLPQLPKSPLESTT